MLSMKEMFYGRTEPVWILNREKDDEEEDEEEGEVVEEDSNAREPEKGSNSNAWHGTGGQQDSTFTYSPDYPYYYDPYRPHPYYFGGRRSWSDHTEAKEKNVVMKIPICCNECEDSIKVPLNEMKGVKFVKCDVRQRKVTVITTTAAPADILLACRKVFRESRMWTDED